MGEREGERERENSQTGTYNVCRVPCHDTERMNESSVQKLFGHMSGVRGRASLSESVENGKMRDREKREREKRERDARRSI